MDGDVRQAVVHQRLALTGIHPEAARRQPGAWDGSGG